MNLNLSAPSQFNGTPEEQIRQVYSYLYQMSEQLNVALDNLTLDNFTEKAAESIKVSEETGLTAKGEDTMSDAYNNAKALIIKTADKVRAEMDTIVLQLNGEYVANSTFGAYQQQVSNEIQATATEIVQSYQFDSRLEAVQQQVNEGRTSIEGMNALINALNSYNVNTEQYIKTGLLYFDANNVPRYGVAVGENLTTITVNGEVVLERTGLAATFTSDRLSFWQNDTEVAYISNNQLYINQVTILSILTIGKWIIDTSYGWALRWAGEN